MYNLRHTAARVRLSLLLQAAGNPKPVPGAGSKNETRQRLIDALNSSKTHIILYANRKKKLNHRSPTNWNQTSSDSEGGGGGGVKE